MEQRISVVTLGVTDLARSRRFYGEGLGWKPVYESGEIVFFQLGGMVLGLFGREDLAVDAQIPPESAGTGGFSLGHVVRSRADVDAIVAKAVASGAKPLAPPQEKSWGGYSGYFADPDGHVWEIAFAPAWKVHSDGSVTFGS